MLYQVWKPWLRRPPGDYQDDLTVLSGLKFLNYLVQQENRGNITLTVPAKVVIVHRQGSCLLWIVANMSEIPTSQRSVLRSRYGDSTLSLKVNFCRNRQSAITLRHPGNCLALMAMSWNLSQRNSFTT